MKQLIVLLLVSLTTTGCAPLTIIAIDKAFGESTRDKLIRQTQECTNEPIDAEQLKLVWEEEPLDLMAIKRQTCGDIW